MAEYAANQLLSRLVGLQMYSVEFVMDYVQLRFQPAEDVPVTDEPVLNLYVWPIVERMGELFRESDRGYADALRRLIPEVVTATTEASGIGLRIEFPSGSITVHPAVDEVYLEIGVLQGFQDGAWMLWQPGGDSFEDLAGSE